MQSILTQLELIDKEQDNLKEQLFEWVVEMNQREFDQLCNEVLGLHRFWEKYRGALVTDEPEMIRPLISSLPKVELLIEINGHRYDRVKFYRWLSSVDTEKLRSICSELETLCDSAIENTNTYLVSAVLPALQQTGTCWLMEREYPVYLSDVYQTVLKWRS